MDELLEKKLGKKFKWMGADFPFSCGDGWYKLIYDLCYSIDNHYKQNKVSTKNLKPILIKRKNGLLYFCLDNMIVGTRQIILCYEHKSGGICELCGKPGKMRRRSLYKVLCDRHSAYYGYDDIE